MFDTCKRFLITAALALCGAMTGHYAHAQVNPFNPDFAWCNTQGSLAMRGATAWQCLTPGTAGQVLFSGGSGANPAWATVSGAGTVTSVGVSVPASMTVSGSPITTAGTIALGFASGAANRIFATPDSTTGAPALRAMTAKDMPSAGQFDGILTGTFPTASMRGNALTNANFVAMPAFTVKGNPTAVSATPVDTTMSALIDGSYSAATGDLLYRSAAGWNVLSPGAANTYLRSNGAGADLSWNDPSGGAGIGTVTSVTCNGGLTGGTITTAGTCALDYSALPNAIPGYVGSSNAPAGILGQRVTGGSLASLTNTAFTAGSITLPAGYWRMTTDIQIEANVSDGAFNAVFCEWTTNNTRVPDGRTTMNGQGFNIITQDTWAITTTDPFYTYQNTAYQGGSSGYTLYLRCIGAGATGGVQLRSAITAYRYR